MRTVELREASCSSKLEAVDKTIAEKERIIAHLNIQQSRLWQAFLASTNTAHKEEPIDNFPAA